LKPRTSLFLIKFNFTPAYKLTPSCNLTTYMDELLACISKNHHKPTCIQFNTLYSNVFFLIGFTCAYYVRRQVYNER